MTLSLNEVEALSRKAVRGVGLSWGLADEAARATRWLCAQSLDGCGHLASALDTLDDCAPGDTAPGRSGSRWSTSTGRMCPLTLGPSLGDFAAQLNDDGWQLEGVIAPAMLLPYASNLARRRHGWVTLRWSDVSATTDGFGLSLSADREGLNDMIASRVDIMAGGQMDTPQAVADRAAPQTQDLASLTAYAARTYAPDTEASRLLGAGAGRSDND